MLLNILSCGTSIFLAATTKKQPSWLPTAHIKYQRNCDSSVQEAGWFFELPSLSPVIIMRYLLPLISSAAASDTTIHILIAHR